MKGLLLKDLLNLKQVGRIWLLIAALWVAMGVAERSSAYIGGMLIMLVIMLPFSSMAYDEAAKWDRYALTMPISRRDLVLSKYALMMICAAVCAALTLLCSLLLGDAPVYAFRMTGLLLCAALFLSAISLPLLFLLGVQKARVAILAFILIPAVVSILPIENQISLSVLEGLFLKVWPVALIVLVLLIVSYICSLRIYRRKEF